MKWELFVRDAESTDKVIFECLDCTFCSIYTMVVWFDELDITVTAVHELFEDSAGLIVGYVECWVVSMGYKSVKYRCECFENGFV